MVIGALPFHYSDISMTLILKFYKISLETGILTSLSMQPIIFIIIASQASYILPICTTLIYSISGLTFASQLVGIHPLASTYGIVWLNSNLEIFVLNIVVIFAMTFVASALLMKKQSC
jgi:hypothetical protein